MDERFALAPSEPLRVNDTVTVLPRGFRFSIGGRSVMSFGGAASLDFRQRTAGVDWFVGEMPSVQDVNSAGDSGPIDVLILHEAVNGGTPAVEELLRTNPMGWSAEELEYSAESRRRVTQVFDAANPGVTFHGHMHVADDVTRPDGRRVVSLAADNQPRNMGVLDPRTLDWSWV